MDKQAIAALIDAQTEMTALDQAFYADADIYQRDIEQYAGHLSEIPAVGDWFLFEMAGESVIVVRSGESEVNALINVCRHRGSKICLDKSGCSRKLVCRYHGWSYNLDGGLHSAAHMKDDFDKSEIKLKKIYTEINLSVKQCPNVCDHIGWIRPKWPTGRPILLMLTGSYRWRTIRSVITAHPHIRSIPVATAWPSRGAVQMR